MTKKKCSGCGRDFGWLDGDLCFLCSEIVPQHVQTWHNTPRTDGPDTDWPEDPMQDQAFLDGDGGEVLMGDITDIEHDSAFDDEDEEEIPTTVKPRDAWWEYDERTNSLVIHSGETRVRVLTGPRNEVVIRCDEGDLVIAPQYANLIRVRVKL